jgi:DNA-binding beta-propeller fold protein YncE
MPARVANAGAPAQSQSLRSRSGRGLAVQRQVYVSDEGTNRVTIYPANVNHPKPVLTITDGVSSPQGVAVDSSGILYVVNGYGGSNDLTEYEPGATQPFRTITTGISSPTSVAVDSQGTLYVANRSFPMQLAWVSEYAKGSGAPMVTIDFPKGNLATIKGIAVDASLNLYANFGSNLSTRHVFKFAAGSTHGVDLGLEGLGTLADGLAVDGGGNLYVGLPSAIAVFPPGSTKAARKISAGISSPGFFSVDAAGALYVPRQDTRNEEVLEFAAGDNHAQSVIRGFESPVGSAIFPSP